MNTISRLLLLLLVLPVSSLFGAGYDFRSVRFGMTPEEVMRIEKKKLKDGGSSTAKSGTLTGEVKMLGRTVTVWYKFESIKSSEIKLVQIVVKFSPAMLADVLADFKKRFKQDTDSNVFKRLIKMAHRKNKRNTIHVFKNGKKLIVVSREYRTNGAPSINEVHFFGLHYSGLFYKFMGSRKKTGKSDSMVKTAIDRAIAVYKNSLTPERLKKITMPQRKLLVKNAVKHFVKAMKGGNFTYTASDIAYLQRALEKLLKIK